MPTFSKNERLCSKILIDRLIEKGKSFNHSPFRITWLPIAESSAPIKVVISVPKRSFKKAVDRNRLKRQIKEVYRNAKQKVYDGLGEKKYLLFIIYTAKTKLEFKEIEQKLIEALQRLSQNVNENN
ncbi:ribonuclease P protein component [soil metagenome]